MKKSILPILAASGILVFSAFATLTSVNWDIEIGHEIRFTSNDPTGIFTELRGDIHFDPKNLDDSKFDMIIPVESINTGNGVKNSHAKSESWFNELAYPYITFKSSNIEKNKDGYSVTGKLKIKEVEKVITFPFTFKKNIFRASFDIDRLEYTVGTMEGKQKNASQTLKIDITVPVKKTK